jgi:hypothetical protein
LCDLISLCFVSHLPIFSCSCCCCRRCSGIATGGTGAGHGQQRPVSRRRHPGIPGPAAAPAGTGHQIRGALPDGGGPGPAPVGHRAHGSAHRRRQHRAGPGPVRKHGRPRFQEKRTRRQPAGGGQGGGPGIRLQTQRRPHRHGGLRHPCVHAASPDPGLQHHGQHSGPPGNRCRRQKHGHRRCHRHFLETTGRHREQIQHHHPAHRRPEQCR